jgi:hypothetical protein
LGNNQTSHKTKWQPRNTLNTRKTAFGERTRNLFQIARFFGIALQKRRCWNIAANCTVGNIRVKQTMRVEKTFALSPTGTIQFNHEWTRISQGLRKWGLNGREKAQETQRGGAATKAGYRRREPKEHKAFNHGLHGLHGWIGQQTDKSQNEMATAEYAEHAENCIWRAHKKSFSNCAILWDSTAKEEMLEFCRELHGLKYSG